MIQSDIFDSSSMNIKKLGNSVLIFIAKRLIEILGIMILILGFLLLISLLSYSPDDPNFIFPENTKIKNYLGFYGSYTSDLFFQSVGLIAFLIPITFIFTGINIFKKKEILFLIENLFFLILYSLIGSIFFTYFYTETFTFYINGTGGFVGEYLSETFIKNFITLNEKISYYTLIFFFNKKIIKDFFYTFKKSFYIKVYT